MSFPAKLLDEGEHVVVSTRSHPKALIGPAAVLEWLTTTCTFTNRRFIKRSGLALSGGARASERVDDGT